MIFCESDKNHRCLCEVWKAPAKHPVFPVYSFFLLDPDGYLVEYQKTGV